MGIRQDTVSGFEQHPDFTRLETFFKILAALNLELTITPRNAKADKEDSLVPSWKEEW